MERYRVQLNGKELPVQVTSRTGNSIAFEVNGQSYTASIQSEPSGRATPEVTTPSLSSAHSGDILAPIPGIVSEVAVREGTVVQPGDLLLVIEAMKMENPIRSPLSGKVLKILANKGKEVMTGELVMQIEGIT